MNKSDELLKRLFLKVDKNRILILDMELRRQIVEHLGLDECELISHGLRKDTISKYNTTYEFVELDESDKIELSGNSG